MSSRVLACPLPCPLCRMIKLEVSSCYEIDHARETVRDELTPGSTRPDRLRRGRASPRPPLRGTRTRAAAHGERSARTRDGKCPSRPVRRAPCRRRRRAAPATDTEPGLGRGPPGADSRRRRGPWRRDEIEKTGRGDTHRPGPTGSPHRELRAPPAGGALVPRPRANHHRDERRSVAQQLQHNHSLEFSLSFQKNERMAFH